MSSRAVGLRQGRIRVWAILSRSFQGLEMGSTESRPTDSTNGPIVGGAADCALVAKTLI